MRMIMFFLLAVILSGCDPGYRIYIRNNASTALYLKTSPAIESFYDTLSTRFDSIVARRIKQEGKFSTYEIKPFNSLLVWGHIGIKPVSNQIPYDYLELINGADTLVLDSRKKIFEQIKAGNKKLDYYIDVLK